MNQLKLWGAVGIILLILAALFYTDLKAYERGYNKKAMEVSKAQENVRDRANSAIEEVKKDVKVVYKYIREQDDNCDIYRNVIDRLPNPIGG